MRSQNRKVKIAKSSASVGRFAGKVSCVGLLALGLALVSPASCSSAFAEEDGDISGASVAEDYGIDTQALSMSVVGISFSPAVGSTSLTPITSVGQSAQINVKATVDVANSGGYSVYLKSNSQNLVGVNNPSNVIPGIAGSVTYDNLSTNTWGYTAVEGIAVPEGASYKAISVSGNGDKIAENSNNKIVTDAKEIMLSFVARIGDDMPADTYQSTVTMSVVSSPVQLALGDISEMQQMTSEICENTAPNASKQLKDVRDGKYYWVAKLADNKCWMTQNLDLDLTHGDKLSSVKSDLGWNGTAYPTTAKEWDPPYTTATTASSSTILADDTGQRSWSLGDYRITNPNTSGDCGSKKADASACTSQFTAYNTPQEKDDGVKPTLGDENAHYILGNHYQWNAATAGTGGTIATGQAADSICPRNWRLPTSNTGGEFEALVTKLGGTSTTDNVTKAPFYGVRGGFVYQNTPYLFSYAGVDGLYWSSTPDSNANSAYNLYFSSTNTVNPSNNYYRQSGRSVRCVAR